MTTDTAALASQESVRRWLTSRASFWKSRSPAASRAREDEGLLATLARFCDFVAKSPDALIDECLQPAKDGQGLVVRVRARRQMIDEIERFEAEHGRDAANVVRSFFIHNGVAMNPGILP